MKDLEEALEYAILLAKGSLLVKGGVEYSAIVNKIGVVISKYEQKCRTIRDLLPQQQHVCQHEEKIVKHEEMVGEREEKMAEEPFKHAADKPPRKALVKPRSAIGNQIALDWANSSLSNQELAAKYNISLPLVKRYTKGVEFYHEKVNETGRKSYPQGRIRKIADKYYLQKMSTGQIAEEENIHPSIIGRWIKKDSRCNSHLYNNPSSVRGRKISDVVISQIKEEYSKHKLSRIEIAKKFGISKATVVRYLPKARWDSKKPISEEVKYQIIDDYVKDMSMGRIARKYGYSIASIHRIVHSVDAEIDQANSSKGK